MSTIQCLLPIPRFGRIALDESFQFVLLYTFAANRKSSHCVTNRIRLQHAEPTRCYMATRMHEADKRALSYRRRAIAPTPRKQFVGSSIL
jgi:hypothetical protein